MTKRHWPTDYSLWALAAAAAFVPLAFIDLQGGSGRTELSLWACLRRLLAGGPITVTSAAEVFGLVTFFGFGAATTGWLVQAALVMSGLRLTGRPDWDQARDYQEPDGKGGGTS